MPKESSVVPTTSVIEISRVTRQYGSKVALDNVSLSVPAGSVFGLVGENGAGKTTLIKHVLGQLRAQQGTVRVFGRDPVADPVGVLSRIGCLSEEADLPAWMSIRQLLRYSRAFYPSWDSEYADALRGAFGLKPDTQVKSLSRGQRARAGLIAALAHRPALLVLDEPSSGLDPAVRRDILDAVLRTVGDEGRTVLFSSHLLSEVEQVSDRVAMVCNGKIIFCDTLERIKEQHLEATLFFETSPSRPPALDGALSWAGAGREWKLTYRGPRHQMESAAARFGARVVDCRVPTLDDIFVASISAPATAVAGAAASEPRTDA